MSERTCRHCGKEIRANMTGSRWLDRNNGYECPEGGNHYPSVVASAAPARADETPSSPERERAQDTPWRMRPTNPPSDIVPIVVEDCNGKHVWLVSKSDVPLWERIVAAVNAEAELHARLQDAAMFIAKVGAHDSLACEDAGCELCGLADEASALYLSIAESRR